MNRAVLAFCLTALMGTSGAFADITMQACFSSAPNAYGSPSWPGYVTNALAGIQTSCTATGDPTQPTYYQSGTTFSEGQVIVTEYNSWDGQVNPPAPFNNEYGNRLHDGLLITDNGTGTKFSLSELTFNMNSSDAADSLQDSGDFSNPADPSDVYSDHRLGIIFGTGGSPDTIVDSGPATQLVDELVYVGIGNAFCSAFVDPLDSCGDPVPHTITDIEAYMDANQPFSVTNTYSLVDALGNTIASVTNTADISPSPEPAMVVVPLAGLLLIGGFAQHRKRQLVKL